MEPVEPIVEVQRIGKNESTPVLRRKATALHERKLDLEKRALKSALSRREIAIMYVQSVLVWNLPFHLLSYLLILYFVCYYGELMAETLNFFQFIGGVMFFGSLLGLLRKIFVHLFGAHTDKAKNSYQPGWLVWPEDSTGLSADTQPLGVALLTQKVKLLSFDHSLAFLAQIITELKRAQGTLRILRFVNPTIHAMNFCVVCTALAIVSSYLNGGNLVFLLLTFLLLLPGIIRRKIHLKSYSALYRNSMGQALLKHVSVGKNLNLEETNSSVVLNFVDTLDEQKRPPKVIIKDVD